MNYDHRFHAGNFADVFKHLVLTRILLYLRAKPAPFRVIDTHAGCGCYDLHADAASRTLEWQAGIGRIDLSAFSPAARALTEPYLDLALAGLHGQASYPGSPALMLQLLRPMDRMIFCEMHPSAFSALKRCVGRDKRAKVVAIDGYVGLNAFVPPVERRGLVLIDPPFESGDEFKRLAAALVGAHAKWREGVFMIWYPIKDRHDRDGLAAAIAKSAIPDVIRLELDINTPRQDGGLAASGLILVKPPYTLEAEMACVLPELQRQLGPDRGRWRIDRLSAE